MKKLICVMLSVSLMLLATSCNFLVKNDDQEQFDYPVTVGNLVFEKAPDGVVVLSDNLADIILACGYEGKLSGRSDICTQEGLELLPSVGTPDSPDIGMLREMNTSLVLSDEIFDDETKQQIADLGADILVIKPASNKNELVKLYGNIASVLGGSYSGKMKAMDTFDSIQESLDSMKNEVMDKNVVSTVCYIYDIDGDQCKVAYGNDYSAELFDYAQLTNIAADDDDGFIGIDVLLRGNPDTIFCAEGVSEKLRVNEDLSSLSAVLRNRIYTLPEKYLKLQGNTCLVTVDYLIAKTQENYTQKQKWPDEFNIVEEVEYVAPFEPKVGIFYTVGETYLPVRYIEERLIGLGYMEGEADETFTVETAAAVSAFQTANGLSVTGIADYDTLTVLLSNDAVSSANAGEATYSPE